MRDELFKQKLSEVAEWEIPVTMDSTEQGRENRKKKLEQAGQDCYNPTYPPKIKKLKTKSVECQDCHKVCEEGRHVEYRIIRNKQNQSFIRRHCKTCNLYDDPYTGQFCLTGTESSQKWMSFAKPVARRYEPKSTDRETRTVIYEDHKNLITKKSEIFDQ